MTTPSALMHDACSSCRFTPSKHYSFEVRQTRILESWYSFQSSISVSFLWLAANALIIISQFFPKSRARGSWGVRVCRLGVIKMLKCCFDSCRQVNFVCKDVRYWGKIGLWSGAQSNSQCTFICVFSPAFVPEMRNLS